jgi:hypothetical protein
MGEPLFENPCVEITFSTFLIIKNHETKNTFDPWPIAGFGFGIRLGQPIFFGKIQSSQSAC